MNRIGRARLKMSEPKFVTVSGHSDNGKIEDAIFEATAKAKNELQSTLVFWELKSLKGQSGGWSQIEKFEVEIIASRPLEP